MTYRDAQQLWSRPGGLGELVRVAAPLVVSNSFWTLQITIDRVLLSRHDDVAVGAAMAGVMLFWTPFALVQNTAGYAATFVAQYVGARRPEQVGPVVWQSIYFSLLGGLAFLLLVPAGGWLIGLFGHDAALREMEVVYFRCLCYSAPPMALIAAATAFFLGRGRTWVVMAVNAVGLVINAALDYLWIDGRWGFPAWGIAGAGWATVAGSWGSAVLAVALLWLPSYRRGYATWRGWRPDRRLFGRLMRFGLPSGLQWAMDGLAFTLFTVFVGRLGAAQISATSIAFTMNLLAFLPTMGIGQAVSVLVGQRLGEDRADLAERSTWTGFGLAWTVMAVIAVSFVLIPDVFLEVFRTRGEGTNWPEVAALVPGLLRFVALYCLFDSMNLVFSFALKGAGDTRFVTVVTVAFAWPMIVLPTWVAWRYDLGLFFAWAAVSGYVITVALIFLSRFRQGRWKSMRVIEDDGATG